MYTVGYYSALKEDEIIKFADLLMEQENIIMSEVTQTQIHKHLMCFVFVVSLCVWCV